MSISPIYVPYSGPIGAPILAIGECPGSDETRLRQPFVGLAGNLFRNVLSSNGIHCASADDCALHGIGINQNYAVTFANLCCYQPDGNQFHLLEDSRQLKEGLAEIKAYIQNHKDSIKVVLLLGNKPIEYILGKYGISKWRGSVLKVDGVVYICANHPSYVQRVRSEYPIFDSDIKKAYRIYKTGYTAPQYKFYIDPTPFELEEIYNEIYNNNDSMASNRNPKIACDIETVKNTNRILCAGISWGPEKAACFINRSDTGLDPSFREVFERFLTDNRTEKIFHNGGFDIEIFHNNGIEVKNFAFDTMVAQHVIAPDLDKYLETITSIYTNIPYYKDKGRTALPENEKGWGKIKDEDKMNIYEYNCLDCIATYQCAEEMEKDLNENPNFRLIFDQEMRMHEISFHVSRTGMPIDMERRNKLKEIVEAKYVNDLSILIKIVGRVINPGSPDQKKKLLYEEWKLPERRDHKTSKITTDEDAIVSLIGFVKDKVITSVRESTKYEWQKKQAGLMLINKLQGFRKLLGTYIDIKISDDNRARSFYRVPADVTGRWACDKYLDDTGWNGQTIPRESLEE